MTTPLIDTPTTLRFPSGRCGRSRTRRPHRSHTDHADGTPIVDVAWRHQRLFGSNTAHWMPG